MDHSLKTVVNKAAHAKSQVMITVALKIHNVEIDASYAKPQSKKAAIKLETEAK